MARDVISTILKHDKKNSSYKIALLRAINDVVLSFPDLAEHGKDVAIPLRMLAEFWIAYYWPFVDQGQPIMQGRSSIAKQDITFRRELSELRQVWESIFDSKSKPADGFLFISEFRIKRKRDNFPPQLLKIYQQTISKIKTAIQQPICYAGPGQHTVFDNPMRFDKLRDVVVPVPGTILTEKCLVITADLWHTFQQLSLWVEALCIHEWSLYTETAQFQQQLRTQIDRGDVYRLLTARPDNRRPLSWERNQIDLVIMENNYFICPWTEKRLSQPGEYDLDHLLPISIYPTNELWNLVPADRDFNQHHKRDRLPSERRLYQAQPHLALAYTRYDEWPSLSQSLHNDVFGRFSSIPANTSDFPEAVSEVVVRLLRQFAEARNLARF